MSKSRPLVHFILDVVLTAIFVSFFSIFFTGMNVHELLGIGIGVLLLVHNFLNYRWIVTVTKNLFNKKITLKTKISYVVDFLLLVAFTMIIVTGIMISKTLFAGGEQSANHFGPSLLHKTTAYIALGLVGIHVGLHVGFIGVMLKKVYSPSAKIKNALVICTTVVCLLVGVFGIYKTDYFGKIIPAAKAGPMNASATLGGEGASPDSANLNVGGYERESVEEEENTSPSSTNVGAEGYEGNSGGENGFGDMEGHHEREQTPKSNVFFSFLVLVFFASLSFALEKCLIRKRCDEVLQSL
ncbi:MAG TPA: DUF4405 domain-containing protein [Caldisericia bacterium]|nr:DUF4405 domain-containing protein [Caldisericia bacterium]HPF49698.1 DUF4405 domain-containing protein [Caldisericia bacterium]HPI84529.1 DUF4405 domain-containing protein [Caldisericia bacterium]HPQ93644.1 DUF4405 domain-containing protein [Caldisericia bacterium]HRV74792.1 DUF4405 domain-containing protein [Caldisericia bacterium]